MYKEEISQEALYARGKKNIESASNIFDKKKFSNDIVQNMLLNGMENLLAAMVQQAGLDIPGHNLGALVEALRKEDTVDEYLEERLMFLKKYSCSRGTSTCSNEMIMELINTAETCMAWYEKRGMQ